MLHAAHVEAYLDEMYFVEIEHGRDDLRATALVKDHVVNQQEMDMYLDENPPAHCDACGKSIYIREYAENYGLCRHCLTQLEEQMDLEYRQESLLHNAHVKAKETRDFHALLDKAGFCF